jgi:hypothetical protein
LTWLRKSMQNCKRGYWHTHIWELPEKHEIMGYTLGLLYTCLKGLLRRRQCKLGVMVINFFLWSNSPKFGVATHISRCKLTVTVFDGQWKTEFMWTTHIRNTIFQEMIHTFQEKNNLTSNGMYCHYVWSLLRSWRLWVRFFSEIRYGDLHGKNSQ